MEGFTSSIMLRKTVTGCGASSFEFCGSVLVFKSSVELLAETRINVRKLIPVRTLKFLTRASE